MSLSEATPPREKIYTRQIVIEGYQRDDGLWDIEGHLTDTRHRDLPMRTGLHPAGMAIHEMLVRITVDDTLEILAAMAETRAAPYWGTCQNITPEYAKLQGLRVEMGFRRELGKLFGGLRGCTHITELLGAMGTAAIQTVRPETEKTSTEKPGQLDGCHALDTAGPVVAYHYPKWHRKQE